MKKRIACSTYGYRFLSLEGALDRIAANGFKTIDIIGTRPHLLPDDYPGDQLDTIRRRIEDLDLTVSAITPFDAHPYWHFTAANPRHRRATIDHVKRCADVAAALGAGVVQAITGTPLVQDMSFDVAWEYAKEGLAECAEHASTVGVRIGLEGEENNIVRTSADTQRMVDQVAHPSLGALLDIGHANAMATDDPVSAIERLKDNIIYCHAHDNHGISDEHNTPGDGTVDWEPVIGALVKAGYDGYIALELLVPNPDGSMSKGRDLLLNYLDAFAGLAS